MKIWIMFGNPETTTGGNALKFFSSQRIEIRKGDKIMQDKEQIGYYAKLRLQKTRFLLHSKLQKSLSSGVFDMTKQQILLRLLSSSSLLLGWIFLYCGIRKFQGKEKADQLSWIWRKGTFSIRREIQSKIKDMRLGKKVLDDGALNAMEAILEEESQSVDEE